MKVVKCWLNFSFLPIFCRVTKLVFEKVNVPCRLNKYFYLNNWDTYLRSKDVILLAIFQALRLVAFNEVEGFWTKFRVASIIRLVARVGQTSRYCHVFVRLFVLLTFGSQCKHTTCKTKYKFLTTYKKSIIYLELKKTSRIPIHKKKLLHDSELGGRQIHT